MDSVLEKSRKDRLSEATSYSEGVAKATRLLIQHLDEHPSKVMRTMVHCFNMSITEPRTTTGSEHFRLHDLMDDVPFDKTYHVHQKVPEYFLMAWLRSKDERMTGDFFTHFKAVFPKLPVVRRTLTVATGLSPEQRVFPECHEKIVLARFFDYYYDLMPKERLTELVSAVIDGTFEWNSVSIWSFDDPDEKGFITCGRVLGISFPLGQDLVVRVGAQISRPESITHARKDGLGGFKMFEAALEASDDIRNAISDYTDTGMQDVAKTLHTAYMKEKDACSSGKVKQHTDLLNVATPASFRREVQRARLLTALNTPGLVPIGSAHEEPLDDDGAFRGPPRRQEPRPVIKQEAAGAPLRRQEPRPLIKQETQLPRVGSGSFGGKSSVVDILDSDGEEFEPTSPDGPPGELEVGRDAPDAQARPFMVSINPASEGYDAAQKKKQACISSMFNSRAHPSRS